jgi:hypothetical protein
MRLGMSLVFVRVIEARCREAVDVAVERLQDLTDFATAADAGAAWLVEAGHPADRLAAVAADREASLIVVGSNGPRSSLLGSVSAEIARRAPCPVVVVPPGADGSFSTESDASFSGRVRRRGSRTCRSPRAWRRGWDPTRTFTSASD